MSIVKLNSANKLDRSALSFQYAKVAKMFFPTYPVTNKNTDNK